MYLQIEGKAHRREIRHGSPKTSTNSKKRQFKPYSKCFCSRCPNATLDENEPTKVQSEIGKYPRVHASKSSPRLQTVLAYTMYDSRTTARPAQNKLWPFFPFNIIQFFKIAFGTKSSFMLSKERFVDGQVSTQDRVIQIRSWHVRLTVQNCCFQDGEQKAKARLRLKRCSNPRKPALPAAASISARVFEVSNSKVPSFSACTNNYPKV